MLLLQDCILTIDAMGCQTEIAFKIVEKGAAYILAVKENQKQLYQDIRDEFRFVKDIQTAISENLDHGRIETKKCSVITNFEHFENPGRWEQLRTIIKIESTREFKNSAKPTKSA